jgi:alcohol dehydrogenase (cytochrome c)
MPAFPAFRGPRTTNDKCGIFTRVEQPWEPGRASWVAWELPQFGAVDSWGGVLSTAGDVVFFCDDSGAFAAADARSGKRLWSLQINQVWKSSPMTYVFDSRQFVAVASGPSILTFALPAASR